MAEHKAGDVIQTPSTWLTALLLIWAVWDLALATIAGLFPDAWFGFIHGTATQDPQALMRRTAGIWLAFAVFHFVAWRRYAQRPFWLVVVGGMRLSELFADAFYRFSASDITTLGSLALIGATFTNLFFSWFFISHGVRRMYGLRYFGPVEYHTLKAVSDVLIKGKDEKVSPRDIALRVDHYLFNFRSSRKALSKIALLGIEFYPLLTFRPPFSTMPFDRREAFIKQRFLRAGTPGRVRGGMDRLAKAMIRFGQQLSFIGYYSHPDAASSVGYTRFSQRARHGGTPPPVPPIKQPLDVKSPSNFDFPRRLKTDVVIIGSGAAGSVMAHDLVAKGHKVTLVERGFNVPRTSFSEDEVESIARLYDEGALQLATDFQLQVLQASCVGGTSVVNNAVCFPPPDHIIDEWNAKWNAQIDKARLTQATKDIYRDLGVRSQGTNGSKLNAGDDFFIAGAKAMGYPVPEPVNANIDKCIGCGYCNIGCKYETKLDTRETFLPRAQNSNAGTLTILSECRVQRIRRRGDIATGIDCRLSNGKRLRIDANTVVLSAGAISSPALLLKSGFWHPSLGRHIGFNVGSPITALLPKRVEAFDGLQISHFLEFPRTPNRPAVEDYVIETWFNPPVSQALGMPGWFEQHFENMQSYAYMNAAAPLVGTTGTGRITFNLTGDVAIDFATSDHDLARIKHGLKRIAKMFLAAGATKVMPATFVYRELTDINAVDASIDQWITDRGDITMGTGHPQGGCPISGDPGRAVVDPAFRVLGMKNLYCCDASVFPSATGVNPQITVMAMARYAAAQIP